ncbi:hypothetical protein HanRHA438_Chr04g0174441 [Helianthus annuus]|nr:hypothetical protein HanRHA438_Chr04g0174441 [Helianthus annuus]
MLSNSKDSSTTLVSQRSVLEPSEFPFIKLTLYYFRSFVNFEPSLRFHFCAHIILLLSYDYTLLACMISRNFNYTFVTSRVISSR